MGAFAHYDVALFVFDLGEEFGHLTDCTDGMDMVSWAGFYVGCDGSGWVQ